tara:strand:- start:2028 stop:2390 length:363 start_codon:yes stop_codon:yes gene_type:complete
MSLKKTVAMNIAKAHSAGLHFAPARDAESVRLTCGTFEDIFRTRGIGDEQAENISRAWGVCLASAKQWVTPSEVLAAYRTRPRPTTKALPRPNLTPAQIESNKKHVAELIAAVGRGLNAK